MTSKRLYWICQFTGWSIYGLNEMITYYLLLEEFKEIVLLLTLNLLVNIAFGITLTHIFRHYFKKFNWLKLPIPRLILRVLLAVFVMTLLSMLINIQLDSLIISVDALEETFRYINYMLNLSKPLLIWVLIYVFSSYIEDRKNDEIEKLKLKSSAKESEAKILKSQMNPHFMFNALNSIRALILEDPAKAQLGITQLSNILRSSLIADRRTAVSLKEELKTIEDYLALEKVRYEERLQTRWDIAPNTLGVQVPPMMLQTLVENAIKHGVQKAIGWGFVEIITQIIDKKLDIKIRNTGQLQTTENDSESGGFGLKNTAQRLQLMYGDEASFKIFQEDDLTVCAEIQIPV
jgi:two-component system, LytTR family, sensor kinase